MAHLFRFFLAEGVGPPSPEFFVHVSSDRISKISVYDGCKLYYFFSWGYRVDEHSCGYAG